MSRLPPIEERMAAICEEAADGVLDVACRLADPELVTVAMEFRERARAWCGEAVRASNNGRAA